MSCKRFIPNISKEEYIKTLIALKDTGAVKVIDMNKEDFAGKPWTEILVKINMCKSKSEARRLIQNGGLYRIEMTEI